LLAHFNVLTSRQLPFLQYSFFVYVGSHFMMIDKRIIFTNFSHKSFGVFISVIEESFGYMENFLLYFTRSIDVE